LTSKYDKQPKEKGWGKPKGDENSRSSRKGNKQEGNANQMHSQEPRKTTHSNSIRGEARGVGGGSLIRENVGIVEIEKPGEILIPDCKTGNLQ